MLFQIVRERAGIVEDDPCAWATFRAKALMAVSRLWLPLKGAAWTAVSSFPGEQFPRLGAIRRAAP
jgi:hypothetical protein